MASNKAKGKGAKWIFLYAIVGAIDAFQALSTATGLGVMISEAIEVVMPFALIGALKKFYDVSIITNPKRLLSILGATGFDALTGGVAPFWIVDVIYIHYDVKIEDRRNAADNKQEQLVQNNIRKPLYVNGARQPLIEQPAETPQTANIDGVRPPNGGLTR
jgi:hypothetical protein